jgi:hypothetical protein
MEAIANFYKRVMEDVIENIREDVISEANEDALVQLKTVSSVALFTIPHNLNMHLASLNLYRTKLWETKLMQSGAISFNYLGNGLTIFENVKLIKST